MENQTYLENENYILSLLEQECKKHKLDFVIDVGIRTIMYNGVFYGFTTRKDWNHSVEKDELKRHAKEHFINELNFVFLHNISYVVRSKHLIGNNYFLRKLADYELCNGIGVYVFNNYGVTGYFLNADHRALDSINFFVNNIANIQKVITKVDNKLQHSGLLLEASFQWKKYLKLCDLGSIKLIAEDRNRLVVLGGHEVFLTPCERQVVKLLQKGQGTKEIARNLTRSPRTIEWHLKNIRKKARVHNTSDLITSL